MLCNTFGTAEMRLYPWFANSLSSFIVGVTSLKADKRAIYSAMVMDVAT